MFVIATKIALLGRLCVRARRRTNIEGGDNLRSVYLNDLRELTGGVNFHMRTGACGRCAECGFTIDAEDESVTVSATGDRIHRACWEDYAADNAEEFFVQEDY